MRFFCRTRVSVWAAPLPPTKLMEMDTRGWVSLCSRSIPRSPKKGRPVTTKAMASAMLVLPRPLPPVITVGLPNTSWVGSP